MSLKIFQNLYENTWDSRYFRRCFLAIFFDFFENILFITEHLWTTAFVTNLISFRLHLSLFYLLREKMVFIKEYISLMLILSEEILWANPRDYLCNYHFGVTAQKWSFPLRISSFFVQCVLQDLNHHIHRFYKQQILLFMQHSELVLPLTL